MQEYADLVSITGGEQFKARVYEKAARSVGAYPEDISTFEPSYLCPSSPPRGLGDARSPICLDQGRGRQSDYVARLGLLGRCCLSVDGGEERRLLAVHAHPDDETITTGGLLARCVDAGVHTALVTCTDGRYGPVNPELGLIPDPSALAQVRREELHAAAGALGVGEVVWLGHQDSGMSGAATNLAPEAFWACSVDMLVGQLVSVVRRFRPHAVVTYDPVGCTGHPDHVQAHRVTLLAVAAAGEAHAMPDTGRAWTVRQVFYPVFPLSEMQRFVTDDMAAGRPHPFEGRSATDINYVRPDDMVTHRVSIGAVYERKRDALYSHRTQVGPHYPQLYRAALARRDYEHFRLAWQTGAEEAFPDIFEAATV